MADWAGDVRVRREVGGGLTFEPGLPVELEVSDDGFRGVLADASRDAVRIFRMDRVLEAEATTETFEVPADFDVAAFLDERGRPYRPGEARETWVRYSPRIARWTQGAVRLSAGVGRERAGPARRRGSAVGVAARAVVWRGGGGGGESLMRSARACSPPVMEGVGKCV